MKNGLSVVFVCVVVLMTATSACRQKGYAKICVVNRSGHPVQGVKLIGTSVPEAASLGTIVKLTRITIWEDILFDGKNGVYIEFLVDGKERRQRIDLDPGFPVQLKGNNSTLELIYNGSLGWTWRVVSE
jgi:hypothetical protein